jgi:hypothetical protein
MYMVQFDSQFDRSTNHGLTWWIRSAQVAMTAKTLILVHVAVLNFHANHGATSWFRWAQVAMMAKTLVHVAVMIAILIQISVKHTLIIFLLSRLTCSGIINLLGQRSVGGSAATACGWRWWWSEHWTVVASIVISVSWLIGVKVVHSYYLGFVWKC